MRKITRYFKSIFFVFTLTTPLTGILANEGSNLPAPFSLIPQPQKVEILDVKGLSYGDLKTINIQPGLKHPVLGEILSLLTETENSSDKNVLFLRLDTDLALPNNKEAYILEIANGKAEIRSAGEAGLFYGCQTLEQLMEDARDKNIEVPACKITDYPATAYRAVQFDVKHHLDHMWYYYQSIDRLAKYKINAVIFEFEDKLRYQRQSFVGAPQAISIDEMAALTKYASDRHIEISPLVQGLGHATFILKHQEYAHLRERQNNRWVFCPLHEGTYQVLFDLYRDAIEATPGSRYLHIGGDEIGNIGLCPRCKPTADKEGLLSLNLYWLKRVCEFAEENGRTPIFWDDMPLKEAGLYETTYANKITKQEAAEIWASGEKKLEKVISEFPENCIYMRWRYDMARQPGNLMALDWYRKHGLKVMLATAVQSGPAALFPYDQRDGQMFSRGIPAIKSSGELAVEKQTEGILCTAWDDRSPHMETYWRGFIASAEYSWAPGKRNLDQFELAYLHREFGITIPNYTSLYGKLRNAAIFWEMAFMKNGSRLDTDNALFQLPGLGHWLPPENEKGKIITDYSKLLIDLPDPAQPGQWSEKYAERLKKAAFIEKEYLETSKALNELYQLSKKNRYHWELYAAINDFQVTAAKFLLALKMTDCKNKKQQKQGVKAVNTALSDFNQTWTALKEVYSKTRFITYPENYVPDRYFHYASQREDLSWMIQVEELFLQKVGEWLNELK